MLLSIETCRGLYLFMVHRLMLRGVKYYPKTLRVSTCELLAQGAKCSSCVSYRNHLRPLYHNWVRQKSSSPSHRQSTTSKTNFRWLSTPERAAQLLRTKSKLAAKTKEVNRMKESLKRMVDQNHLVLDPTLESDMAALMNQLSEKVHQDNPENSFWENILGQSDVSP